MVTKHTLVRWLALMPENAQLAIDACGALVQVNSARWLAVGPPPEEWCAACGRLGSHTKTCAWITQARVDAAARAAAIPRIPPTARRGRPAREPAH